MDLNAQSKINPDEPILGASNIFRSIAESNRQISLVVSQIIANHLRCKESPQQTNLHEISLPPNSPAENQSIQQTSPFPFFTQHPEHEGVRPSDSEDVKSARSQWMDAQTRRLRCCPLARKSLLFSRQRGNSRTSSTYDGLRLLCSQKPKRTLRAAQQPRSLQARLHKRTPPLLTAANIKKPKP